MLNALQINQKSYTLSTFPSSSRRNFVDSMKVLAITVSEFYQNIEIQPYQPTLIRWLSLLYVYKWTIVSVIAGSLFISVHQKGDFVTRFCQPSRNVLKVKCHLFNNY